MFKIGWKAAELKRTKLQSEILKEESELRRKRLEKRVKMASGKDTKGGCMKSPKQEDDDDDFLEDLVVDSDPKKPKKLTTYSNLKPGSFVMKAEDRKGRLEKDGRKLKRQKTMTMTMMTMMKKPKRNNWNGKRENYRANSGKLKRQQKRLEIKKNEKRQHGLAKGFRVECS